MSNRSTRIALTLSWTIYLLTGCGGPKAVNQADLQATVAAQVQATIAAQQPPTAGATSAPPTQAPVGLPTTQAFAPSPQSAPPDAATAQATPAPSSLPAPTGAAQPSGTTAPAGSTSGAPAPDQPIMFQPSASGEASTTVNIELVFDSSGSMAENIGGETKIQAARRSMERLIDQLPADAPRLNVGFRVYGHKGDNSEAQKALSCQSSDLLVPVQGVNKDLLRQQANAWEPTGWTPISLALQRAGEDLKAGENVRNVIIMVTDGEETCAGDPCLVAKALNESGAEVRIDVVGFGLKPDVAKTLKCIADNSGGSYSDAQNGDALGQTLEQLINESLTRSTLNIRVVGPDGKPLGAYVRAFTDQQGQRVDINKDVDTGTSGSDLIDGKQRIELPPGTYHFTIEPNASSSRQTIEHRLASYAAVVAEGQETVAVVGYGSLTAINDGAPAGFYGTGGKYRLYLELARGGKWQQTLPLPAEFNRPYLLVPGQYRITRQAAKDIGSSKFEVVVENIVIEAGKAIDIRIKTTVSGP